jgi:WD40 repeat protein
MIQRPQKITAAFPLLGLNEYTSYGSSPPGTTPDCLNVRPHDSLEQRARGGQRSGISKYYDNQPNGTNAIQFIGQMTEAVALSEEAGFPTKYADPANLPGGTVNDVAWRPQGDYYAVAGANGLAVYRFDPGTGTLTRTATAGTGNARASLSWSPDGLNLAVVADTGSTTLVYTFDAIAGTVTQVLSTSTPTNARFVRWGPDGTVFITSTSSHAVVVRAYAWNGSTLTEYTPTVTVTGNTNRSVLAVSSDGTRVFVQRSQNQIHAFEWIPGVGWGTEYGSNGGTTTGTAGGISLHPDGDLVAISRSADTEVWGWNGTSWGSVVATAPTGGSGGQAVAWRPQGDFISVKDAGAGRFTTYAWTGALGSAVAAPSPLPTGAVNAQAWAPDGATLATGHATSPQVSVYSFLPATVNPSARRARVVAVSGGNVYRSTVDNTGLAIVNNGTGAQIAAGISRGREAYQRMFFCDSTADGYVYLDYADNTVKDWASDVTDGALPVGNADPDTACRLITLYRGRIVLAGLLEEPQNWFMSRSGNPFDWDYSPTTPDGLEAIAGNNSEAGELGDVLTCLAPFRDDLLVMGGANSLWVMQGDPAAGGAIDNVSRQLGIVGPDAYAWTPTGTLFFLGQNGLYRWSPGTMAPEPASRGRLDKSLSTIDVSTSIVRMTYDLLWQGVHIFVTPLTEPDAPMNHWFWDERTDSFWRDQYPTRVGPTAVALFESDDPERRAVLLGGHDGYIRHFDPSSLNDDGDAISSYIVIPPIQGDGFTKVQHVETRAVLDRASGDLELAVYRGREAQEATQKAIAGGVPSFATTLYPGQSKAIKPGVSAASIAYRLSNSVLNTTWALESLAMSFIAPAGQRRRNG